MTGARCGLINRSRSRIDFHRGEVIPLISGAFTNSGDDIDGTCARREEYFVINTVTRRVSRKWAAYAGSILPVIKWHIIIQ